MSAVGAGSRSASSLEFPVVEAGAEDELAAGALAGAGAAADGAAGEGAGADEAAGAGAGTCAAVGAGAGVAPDSGAGAPVGADGRAGGAGALVPRGGRSVSGSTYTSFSPRRIPRWR